MFVDHVHHTALRGAIERARPGSIVLVDALCGAGLSTSVRRFVLDEGEPPAELAHLNGRLLRLWSSNTLKASSYDVLNCVSERNRGRYSKPQSELEALAIEAVRAAGVKLFIVEDVHDLLFRPARFESTAALLVRIIQATGARLVLGGPHPDDSKPISVLLRDLPSVGPHVSETLSMLALEPRDPSLRMAYRSWARELPVANPDYFDSDATYERLYRLSGTLDAPGLFGWLDRLFSRLERFLEKRVDEADYRSAEHRRAFGGDAQPVEVTDELMAEFADTVLQEDGRGSYVPDRNPFSGRSWIADRELVRAKWEELTRTPPAIKRRRKARAEPKPILRYSIMDALRAPADAERFAEGDRRYVSLDGIDFEIRFRSKQPDRYRVSVTGPHDVKGRRRGKVFELGVGSSPAHVDFEIDSRVHPVPQRQLRMRGSPFYPPLPEPLLEGMEKMLEPRPSNLSRSQEAQLRQICKLLGHASGTLGAYISYRTPLTALQVSTSVIGGPRPPAGALETLQLEIAEIYDPYGWVSTPDDIKPLVSYWQPEVEEPLGPDEIAARADRASYITPGMKEVLCSIAQARVSLRERFARRKGVIDNLMTKPDAL